MNLFRTTAAVLALSTTLLTLPLHAAEMAQGAQVTTEVSQQNASGNNMYTNDAPKGYAMLGDLLIARPLLIAATVIGTAAFVVSLPFSALGGNVKEAGQALVVEPGREAFVRCLGCDTSNSSYPN
jgi:hypothetical protein